MKYTCDGHITFQQQPMEWNKDSGKEVLQYCVGGLLYMPASNSKIAGKIISGEFGFVKSLVLDLEDSIGDDMVKFGEQRIIKTMAEIASAVESGLLTIDQIPMIFIRVREPVQILATMGLLGSTIKYITGFNMPKFDKTTCDNFIEAFTTVQEKVYSQYRTDLYMMPIIESKNAMYRQLRMDNLLYINDKLRPITNQVLNIRVGGADFCAIFGVRRNCESTIYEIGPVGDCLNDILNVFGKGYIVSAPVWEYFGKDTSGAWAEGLRRELRADRLTGFIGKTAIHPSQLRIIQESLVVEHTDYMDAIGVLGMNTNTVGVKKSDSGDRMSEAKTHSKWASKIIGLANVYGVKNGV